MFAPATTTTGVRGVHVFPLNLGAVRCGVLAVYLDHAAGLGGEALADAWALATLALDLLMTRASDTGEPMFDPGFLDDRPEIHQAVGMVAAQLGIGVGEAFLRIRGLAFAEARSLSEMAVAIVTRDLRFDTLE